MTRKRGRPPYKASAKQRRTVEEMRSCGESVASIARALDIDEDTLLKHFEQELAHGQSRRRREVIELLYRNARRGNVSAQKRLEQMTSPRPADENVATRLTTPAKLGKKEQANLDALHPDTASPMGELMARRAADVKLH